MTASRITVIGENYQPSDSMKSGSMPGRPFSPSYKLGHCESGAGPEKKKKKHVLTSVPISQQGNVCKQTFFYTQWVQMKLNMYCINLCDVCVSTQCMMVSRCTFSNDVLLTFPVP